MKARRNNASGFEKNYENYLAEKKSIVDKLIAWVHGKQNDYPYSEVEEFLRKHAREDELSRVIVVEGLAIECLASCFGKMNALDFQLMEQARNVPKPG